MITKRVVREEFDHEKINRGDIISYLRHIPGLRDKYVRCHGVITNIHRDTIHVTGTVDDGALTDLIFNGNDVERLEITIVIRNENITRK